ncbi:terminase small subunit [Aquimarina sp. 2201CG5-10]|uniref:terminase small subunit n=1 Tax=Aquimarina callyspongiae TaxID=3098150 RepID=UPI002AB51FF6|nr:terminase small subunit [Aquimarina sp. 2201CG5-10]MDY8137571.1 terminase small subunit [Aquimarina sp. 2201CG5-10]
MRKLTKKQKLFATEFVKLGDASAAYRKAYSASKMTSKTINECASKLLKNPKITARVRELQAIAAEVAEKEFKIDSKEILNQLNIFRNSRIDEYVEFKNNKLTFKDFDKLTGEQLMCIESIKQGRNGIELKLHGKDWTIEKIAKHIGFYEKDNNQRKSSLTIFELPDNKRD